MNLHEMVQKLTLLFVDDDPQELAQNKERLEPHGYHVLTATDTATAMRIIAERHVDGVVLEYQMSPQNGEVVAMDIWRKYLDIPIILFSNNPHDIPPRLMTAVDVFADKAQPLDDLLQKLKTLFRGEANSA